MFTFLLVVQALIAASLVGVILMQQSEGGGLGMGGSPTGLMSARGAANFLTRATGILAIVFVALSIAMAVLATQKTTSTAIDTSLARKPAPVAPAPVVPLSGDPAAPAVPGATGAAAPAPAPATSSNEPVVPMAATPKAVEQRPATRPVAPASTQPAAPRVVPTQTLPLPLMSNNPTPAPTDDELNGN